MKKALFGMIYMSSYKIQLNIVDLHDLTILEKIDSPSFVQADSKSQVFEQDMDKICDAIEGFKLKLAEYQIKNYKFYGNEQLIDEMSASFIADQIRVRTGLNIEWLNGGQIVYAKVLSGLKSLNQDITANKYESTYLLSLGSAMINLSLFKNHKFISSWSLPLGPHEIQQLAEITNETPNDPIDVISDYLGAKIDHLARQIKDSSPCSVIIQHADALNAAFLKEENSTNQISREDFDQFYNRLIEMPVADMIQKYHLEPTVAVHTIPNAISIHQFLSLLNVKDIYVTDLSVITGLLMLEGKKSHQKIASNDIVMTSAQNMASWYLVDMHHANQVRKFALHIFDRLRKVHLLSKQARTLLALAATVDNIGSFVNQQRRFEQSAEILDANKLIGLSDRDNEIVSEICRYQTINDDYSAPDIGGHHYRHLAPDIQLEVAKLSAILRLATALDASHRQKIKKIVLSIKTNNHLIIHAKTNSDITLERWSFNKRAKLFEDVFGIKVTLKQEGMNR
ncbi:hypothetical protein [Lactobacillus ultunensis]|uniref:Ppx/GppA phosphatase C-terminal domain-containing protein n=1 Tax=Lactobacillus ultunensis DSM 16047 TaxID=525365 RepID=C2EN81_9LACO|nr:hypothetical protein [Lactobacillus ultunensis]EEJ71885.1 hypothetical protein HMPREF0548_1127 [Lactobacillus ultunensis DSM 16047]KRL82116.1 exopolyphosphatase [Lactobacillus ultunensis DSM 16047]QQP27698.1 exopolyphosphatase [Lactobacillus ultunensis]